MRYYKRSLRRQQRALFLGRRNFAAKVSSMSLLTDVQAGVTRNVPGLPKKTIDRASYPVDQDPLALPETNDRDVLVWPLASRLRVFSPYVGINGRNTFLSSPVEFHTSSDTVDKQILGIVLHRDSHIGHTVEDHIGGPGDVVHPQPRPTNGEVDL